MNAIFIAITHEPFACTSSALPMSTSAVIPSGTLIPDNDGVTLTTLTSAHKALSHADAPDTPMRDPRHAFLAVEASKKPYARRSRSRRVLAELTVDLSDHPFLASAYSTLI